MLIEAAMSKTKIMVQVVAMPRLLSRRYTKHRYAILFYSLLLTLAAVPLLAALDHDTDLIRVPLAFDLIVAVLSLHHGLGRSYLLFITITSVAVGLTAELIVHPLISAVIPPLMTAIAFLTAAGAVRFAMRARNVDVEHVYAGLSAYLLAGVFFGVLHWRVEQVWPGSYAGSGGGFSLASAIYFSFVTLATLGYGDLVPKTELARGLAVLEAVAGQLYIAVMLARLVSAHVQSGNKRDKS
jgi:hypothetical protein